MSSFWRTLHSQTRPETVFSRQMIEEKLDGERIQLHKKGEKFQYWSRYVVRLPWLCSELRC